jgi:hypothetical protein
MRELPAAGAPKEHPNRPAVSDGSSGTRVAPLAGAVPSVLEPTPLGLPPSPKWLYGSVRPPERTFDETKRATQASGIDLAMAAIMAFDRAKELVGKTVTFW